MVKQIASVNNNVLSLHTNGTLSVPAIQSSKFEHPTYGTGNNGQVIKSAGNGEWIWEDSYINLGTTETNNNLHIGYNVPFSTGSRNTVIGINSGTNITYNNNTFIGPNIATLDLDSGGNTVVGAASGEFLTGAGNTAFGAFSLKYATGSFNVAVGQATLNQPNNSGNNNIAVGTAALKFMNNGNNNTAIGSAAGRGFSADVPITGIDNYFGGRSSGENITSGSDNVGIGANSLQWITTGTNNVAIGSAAGRGGIANTVTGSNNFFGGLKAGYYVTSASDNVGIGAYSLNFITTGTNNIAIGSLAGHGTDQVNPVTGSNNFFGGLEAGYYVTSASDNVGIGAYSLKFITEGTYNVAIGSLAGHGTDEVTPLTGSNNFFGGQKTGYHITSGKENVGIGSFSLQSITSGEYNVTIGVNAFDSLITGANNVAIGYNCQASAADTTNEIVIGSNSVGYGSNTITLGDTNIVELHIPGLQSGKTDGDVLTFDGSKLVLTPPPFTGIEYAHIKINTGINTNPLYTNRIWTVTRGFEVIGQFNSSSFVHTSNFSINTDIAGDHKLIVLSSGIYSIHFTVTGDIDRYVDEDSDPDLNGLTYNGSTSRGRLFINGIGYSPATVSNVHDKHPLSTSSGSYTHIAYFEANTYFNFRFELHNGGSPVKLFHTGNQITIIKLG